MVSYELPEVFDMNVWDTISVYGKGNWPKFATINN